MRSFIGGCMALLGVILLVGTLIGSAVVVHLVKNSPKEAELSHLNLSTGRGIEVKNAIFADATVINLDGGKPPAPVKVLDLSTRGLESAHAFIKKAWWDNLNATGVRLGGGYTDPTVCYKLTAGMTRNSVEIHYWVPRPSWLNGQPGEFYHAVERVNLPWGWNMHTEVIHVSWHPFMDFSGYTTSDLNVFSHEECPETKRVNTNDAIMGLLLVSGFAMIIGGLVVGEPGPSNKV